MKALRFGTFLCLPILIGVSIFGLFGLSTTTDTRSLFSNSDQHYLELLTFEDVFSPYTSLMIVIQGGRPIFEDPTHARAHIEASRLIGGLKDCVSFSSLSNLPISTSNASSLDTSPALTLVGDSISWFGVETRSFQNLTSRLILSDDLTLSAVKGFFNIRGDSPNQVAEANARVAKLLDALSSKYPTLQFYATGGLAMMGAFDQIARSDLTFLGPAAFAVIGVVTYLLLLDVRLTALLLAQSSLAVLVTMGTLGFGGVVLNSATSSIPVVVFAISFAMTMHLMLHIVRGTRARGVFTTEDVVVSAVKSHTAPMALTALTTVIGMMSLVFVPSPPIRTLGLSVSIGTAISFFVAVTLVPAVASNLKQISPSSIAIRLQSAMNSLARAVEAGRSRWLLSLAMFLFLGAGVTAVNVDDDFISYFSASTDFAVATKLATDNLVGPYNLEILLQANKTDTLVTAQGISTLTAIQRLVESHSPAVIRTVSLIDVLTPLKDSMYNEQTALGSLTDDELSQLYLAYELSLSKELANSSLVSSDLKTLRVSTFLEKSTSQETQDLISELKRKIQPITPKGFEITITGESVPTAFLSEKNITEMLKSIAASLLISSLLLGAIFRSFRLSAVVFIAIAAPVCAGFGLWGWAFGSIGLAATVVIALAVGIVIDDTIHLVFRYRDGLRNLNLDSREAAAYAIHRSGTAVVSTTTILSSAFLTLSLSSFQLNVSLGLATAILLMMALVFDLTILPDMLRRTFQKP